MESKTVLLKFLLCYKKADVIDQNMLINLVEAAFNEANNGLKNEQDFNYFDLVDVYLSLYRLTRALADLHPMDLSQNQYLPFLNVTKVEVKNLVQVGKLLNNYPFLFDAEEEYIAEQNETTNQLSTLLIEFANTVDRQIGNK